MLTTRPVGAKAGTPSGNQASVTAGSANPSSTTPMTVKPSPPRRISCPTAARSPPNAATATWCERITTRAGVPVSSATVNTRPRAGATSIAAKKPCVTLATCSGRASPWSSQPIFAWNAHPTALKSWR